MIRTLKSYDQKTTNNEQKITSNKLDRIIKNSTTTSREKNRALRIIKKIQPLIHEKMQ